MGRTQIERQPRREESELLGAKLTLPGLHGPLVERAALFARLDAGLQQHMILLLSAPAGAGKTTLVRAWLAERAQRGGLPQAGRVSLDAGENDPLRFWNTMARAWDFAYRGCL